jgi:hypothetical protein
VRRNQHVISADRRSLSLQRQDSAVLTM